MQPAQPAYKDQVLAVEPLGAEFVPPLSRHGKPAGLFMVWFSANAEIATWVVGFTIGLAGGSFTGAALGILIGNLLGFGLLGVLATFGPSYGVPQMVASRAAFGWNGNALPAGLSFLAGVGWFAINTIFGAYALQSLVHVHYALGLLFMLGLQIALAVYGYNLIHVFERAAAALLAIGFIVLGVATALHFSSSPALPGSMLTGIMVGGALAFAYAMGWVPCAADYSRYLPENSDARAVWLYSFAGCALPCIVLEIMGAGIFGAVNHLSADTSPTQAISMLLGNGMLAGVVLFAVVLGTLTANCMNLYSGAMAALVVRLPGKSIRGPLLVAIIFFALTCAVMTLAHASALLAIVAGLLIAAIIGVVARFSLSRWRAALVVGLIGAVLSTGGGHPDQTASFYTSFLLLLSYWASPWAAVVFMDWLMRKRTGTAPQPFATTPSIKPGTYAWIIGMAASIPFWSQTWFLGAFAKKFPQFGDLSYYVGFLCAAIAMVVLSKERFISVDR